MMMQGKFLPYTRLVLARLSLMLLLLMQGLGQLVKAAEDLKAWEKSMAITFEAYNMPGASALIDFPVLIVFKETDAGNGFYYNDFLSPPYDDLRFAAADKSTQLDFEIDVWDETGSSYVWVKVPELTASTVIYAFWGKEDVEAPACTTDGSVWSDEFTAVWHMNEPSPLDATGNANHGVGKNGVDIASGGAAGNALLNQSAAYHYVDCGTGLRMRQGSVTLGIWFKTIDPTRTMGMIGKSRANFAERYSIHRQGTPDGPPGIGSIFQGNAGSTYIVSDSPYTDNQWHHAVAVFDRAANMTLYVDGQYQKQINISAAASYDMNYGGIFLIGAYGNSAGSAPHSSYHFNGMLDEARISGVVRKPDWIWAEYMTVAENGVFPAYGAPMYVSVIEAGHATNVLGTTAWLTGTLVTTGFYETAVSAYWGLSDGGENPSAWDGSAILPAPQPVGPLSIQATDLQPNATYFYRLMAENPSFLVWSAPSVFITGEVGLECMSDAFEQGEVPGKIRVYRSALTMAQPLTVYYTVSGTATPGDDYEPLSGEVTIPALQTSVEIEIKPLYDHLGEDDETVILTLEPGPYVVGPSSEATVTIFDRGQVTCIWTGNQGSDWFTPGNWDVNEVPYIGAKAVINGGPDVSLEGETHPLLSLDMNGGKLVFDGWESKLVCREITINGGQITHAPNTTDEAPWAPNARVYLECSNLTIAAAGAINVSEQGFFGSYNSHGRGPGAGSYAGPALADSASGGGHGGIGLPFHTIYAFGNTYDDVAEPLLPGSSGGAYYAGNGGRGGGVVYIDAAGKVRVNGVIAANGGQNANAAGGAGGSIYIRCSTFAGAHGGVIEASGGLDGRADGIAHGGGGRIAVHYNTALQALEPQPQVVFRAQPGERVNYASAMGTLYLSDAFWARAPFSRFDGVWLHGDWLADFTIAGDFMPTNSIGFGEAYGKVQVTGDLFLSNVCFGVGPGVEFACHAITLTSNAAITVHSALVTVTNVTTPEYGALVDASGEVVINSGCWVYPQVFHRPYTGINNTNGVASLFKARTMTIFENAGFDSDSLGYPGGDLSDDVWGNGTGAGAGLGSGSYGLRGASHGGRGAGASDSYCYGSVYAPVLPGSGGAPGGYGVLGYTGGGAIHIEIAEALDMSGILTANAADGGSGSGGSIFLTCDELRGSQTAALRAEGRAGGGGGRISVVVGLPAHEIQNLLNARPPHGRTTTITSSHPSYEGLLSVAGDEDGAICIITYAPIGTVLTTY